MPGLLNSPLSIKLNNNASINANSNPRTNAAPAAPAMSAPAATPAAGNMSTLSDPILQRIEAGIAQRVAGPVRPLFLSSVNAGMALMFSQQSGARMMNRLKSSPNPMNDIPIGMANMFAVVMNQIGGRLPPVVRQRQFLPALLGAVAVWTCHALDVAEKLGRLKVTPQLAAQTVHAAVMACLAKVGVNQQQMQQAVAAGRNGAAQAPAATR